MLMDWVPAIENRTHLMPAEDPKPVDPREDRHLQHSAYDTLSWLVAASAVSATPFVQALLSELGTRSGQAIDNRTRQAARRFLRRHTTAEIPGTPRVGRVRTTYGWLVIFEQTLPAEGVVQLAGLCESEAPSGSEGQPVAPGQIHWIGGRWMASAGEGVALFEWDDAGNEWVPLPRRSPRSSGGSRA
jgi:hypothetical protein